VSVRYDIAINGGTLVHPHGRVAGNIGIRGERIAAIAGVDEPLDGDRLIDARGKYVLPGRIDPHVHMYWPDWPMDEGIRTATRAAIAGGTTTVLHFVITAGSLIDHFANVRELFDANAYSDGAFHGQIVSELNVTEIPELARRGIISFKFSMAYRGAEAKPPLQGMDDGLLFRGFREVGRLGPGALALVHAENIEVFFPLRDELKASGRTDVRWTEARPPFLEEEAMNRAIVLADGAGCPLYIVHITISEGVRIVREARARGRRVTGETCPQYLTLTKDSDPVRAKINPPLRETADSDALWAGLAEGVLSTVGSDHAPTSLRHKQELWSATVGVPGVETALPLLLSEGVNKGRLSLERLVEVTALQPARTFGLYPRKGTLQVGSDADIVVVDLGETRVVNAKNLHQGSDFSPYDGMRLQGWPVVTLLRGRVVMEGGEILARPGDGRFIPRSIAVPQRVIV
jgi:dihydropyrimidinase